MSAAFEVPEEDDARPRLLAVHVSKYKNLRDTWVGWSDGMILFGQNGVGKTNFLEVLAILFGTDLTLSLASPRLASPKANDLAAVLEVSTEELPGAPSLVHQVRDQLVAEGDLPSGVGLPFFRAVRDSEWWRLLGVAHGDSFQSGLEQLFLPESLLDYLTDQIERPVIRFDLVKFEHGNPEAGITERMFHRTLLGRTPPPEIVKMAPLLPDVFSPLRSSLGLSQGDVEGFVDLMTLPMSSTSPVSVEWLARARSSMEAYGPLEAAYVSAELQARNLVKSLENLPATSHQYAPQTEGWLHIVADRALSEELAITLPHVRTDIYGEFIGLFLDLFDSRESPPRLIGATGDSGLLDMLSSGERRWVDEAMASTTRALRRFERTLSWQARLMGEVTEESVLEGLLEAQDELNRLYERHGCDSAESLDYLMAVLQSRLSAAAQEYLNKADSPFMRTWLEASIEGLDSLRPELTIRVFDEPEAHLHPLAQRAIAEALDTLRLRGDNVVVASHSPHFLGRPHWGLVRVQGTPEGATISPLTEADLHARTQLAVDLGLTRGELLTRVAYLLIVEGEHDRLMLESFYGDDLADAGVAILRMHGTGNLLATAELDFIQRYLDVPVGVLLDNTRTERVFGRTPMRDLTAEELQLKKLLVAAGETGRRIEPFGLHAPDVVIYLDEASVTELEPNFPGWQVVLEEFTRLPQRPSFKKWIRATYGVDLTHTFDVQRVIEHMLAAGRTPRAEFGRVVRDVLLSASSARWPDSRPPSDEGVLPG